MAGHPLFAVFYDRLMAGTERAGLAGMRAELLASAAGRTLELGAGTGANAEHYPAAVTELVATEPDPHMAKRLRARYAAGRSARPGEVVEAAAERLPFPDDSFDTVVATLVLCTVDDPAAAAAEIRRVLRADGRLLVLEHVRAGEGDSLVRWQDRLRRPWSWLGAGCQPNRDTAASLQAAGFDVSRLEPGRMPKAPAIVRPLIKGPAAPAG